MSTTVRRARKCMIATMSQPQVCLPLVLLVFRWYLTFESAVLPKPSNSTDTPPPPPSPPPSQSQLSQGEIVGIAVGTSGGILFAGVVGLIFWYWKRGRRNQQHP